MTLLLQKAHLPSIALSGIGPNGCRAVLFPPQKERSLLPFSTILRPLSSQVLLFFPVPNLSFQVLIRSFSFLGALVNAPPRLSRTTPLPFVENLNSVFFFFLLGTPRSETPRSFSLVFFLVSLLFLHTSWVLHVICFGEFEVLFSPLVPLILTPGPPSVF